jgi:uncharacterized protein (TIGR03437 family)
MEKLSATIAFMRLAILMILAELASSIASAQLVQPNAIPNGVVPVVFLNGYQLGCTGDTSFETNFGSADQVLQASGLVSVYFDNCSVPYTSETSIETLGISFGEFLGTLRYVNGNTVPLVDVVAHSMGGLIVRAYLSGKQNVASGATATFIPPASIAINKAVFLATPHFGTAVATEFGLDTETQEMSLGSQFLFDLNTWNQGTDDLRGVNALAIAGDGGTGAETALFGPKISGFDDGVVELTSASIGFAISGHTRVVPDCHANDLLIVALGGCAAGTPALNAINDTSNVVGQIIVSFLNGTSAWSSLGQAIESTADGSAYGGLLVEAADMNGNPQTITSATAGGNTLDVNAAAYKEAVAVPSTPQTLMVDAGASLSAPLNLLAGTSVPVLVKPGPSITGVVPAGIAQYPRNVAPGAFVTVYGSNLASSVAQASQPYPTQLDGVQVVVDGIAAPIQYVGPGQINLLFPSNGGVTGLRKLTVTNSAGQETVNVVQVPAVPSIFTITGVASGPAAAENAQTYAIINANNPLHAGDYVALYLTGIDETITSPFGLVSTVTVGGQSCAGQYFYAGVVASVTGLDQVNCQIPAGVTGPAVPVIVTTNGRASNTATLNIQ